MGCSASATVKAPQFTPEEKKIIRQTWLEFAGKGLIEGGAYFFEELFRLHPDAQELFKSMHGIKATHQSLLESNEIRAHFRRVFGQVEDGVNHLDNLTGYTKQLIALGDRHNKYKVKRVYIKTAGKCLMHALKVQLGDHMTKEAVAAWLKLWTYMETALLTKLKYT